MFYNLKLVKKNLLFCSLEGKKKRKKQYLFLFLIYIIVISIFVGDVALAIGENLELTFGKKFVLLIFLVLIIQPLFSSTLIWSWDENETGINWYRYKTSIDSEYTLIDSKVREIEIDKEYNKLYLSQSRDGIVWSKDSVGVYLREKNSSKFSLSFYASPYTVSLFSFYNAHSIASAKDLTITKYGYTLSFATKYDLSNSFRLASLVSYSFAIKNGTVIPGARDIYNYSLQLGIDWIIKNNSKYKLYTGLGGGVVLITNNNKGDLEEIITFRIGLERSVTEHLSLLFESSVNYSNLDAADPLYKSNTYRIEPINIGLNYKF